MVLTSALESNSVQNNVHCWILDECLPLKSFPKQPILQHKCLDHAESLLFDAGGFPGPGQHQGARVVHH
jgi:hypothetical protein